MSDSKKPKLSEIQAREQASSGVNWRVIRRSGEPCIEASDGRGWPITVMQFAPFQLRDAEFIAHAKTDIPHLLDLVERMGETIDHSVHSLHFKHIGNFWNCERLGCKEARELLKEIEK